MIFYFVIILNVTCTSICVLCILSLQTVWVVIKQYLKQAVCELQIAQMKMKNGLLRIAAQCWIVQDKTISLEGQDHFINFYEF